MENPFKFGSIVEGNYFTDRAQEVAYIRQYIEGPNHLILISPRRFGKSSVVRKALRESGRDSITLNLQHMVSVNDLAAALLKELFKAHPLEQLRHFFTHFRVIPTISSNPLTGAIEVAFQPGMDSTVVLEDVMALLDRVGGNGERLVIVLDEFQEILDIAPHLDKQLRAIMQQQQQINYILLGSQESMMTDIFENKKSPFYHFGELMRLKKLPYDDFEQYISSRLQSCCPNCAETLAKQILDYTQCHPYYGQQLSAEIWQLAMLGIPQEELFDAALNHIVETHNLDYERLWQNFTRTSKWIFKRLALNLPLQTGEYRTSTIYSALKKLQKDGYVNYSTHYEIEDPYFQYYIRQILQGSAIRYSLRPYIKQEQMTNIPLITSLTLT